MGNNGSAAACFNAFACTSDWHLLFEVEHSARCVLRKPRMCTQVVCLQNNNFSGRLLHTHFPDFSSLMDFEVSNNALITGALPPTVSSAITNVDITGTSMVRFHLKSRSNSVVPTLTYSCIPCFTCLVLLYTFANDCALCKLCQCLCLLKLFTQTG